MNASDRLSHALDDLRDEHRNIQPPAHVRVLVQASAGAANLPSPLRRRLWSVAFAACTLLFFCLLSVSIVQFHLQRQRNDSSARISSPVETTTAFIPLPSSAGLPPPQETSLLRVRMQESELRQFGLEVPEPFSTRYTQVEFAVGEDGLARAVRFIQPASSGSRP